MADKQYGYESGYGAGAPTGTASQAPQYGYESGYGTSTQPQQPWYQEASDTINSAEDAVANSSIGQKVGQVATAIAPAVGVAKTLTGIVTPGSGIPELAQDLAPAISQAEGQAVSDYGLKKGYPLTGAGIGTGISMIPDAVAAYVAWKGIHNVDNPIVKGLVNSPQELGPEYQALDQKAGVSGKLPVQRGTIAKYPGLDGLPSNVPPTQAPEVSPLSYPKDTNTYLNFVKDRLDGVGKSMAPQELSDHKTMLNSLMTKMTAQGQGSTPVFAKAAQAASDITDLQNEAIKGRASLNTAYGISKGQQSLTDFIKKWGLRGLEGTVLAGLGKEGYDYFKK